MQTCNLKGCTQDSLNNSAYCFEHYKLGFPIDGFTAPGPSRLKCPDSVTSLIEEWHDVLHRIEISRMIGLRTYKQVGVIRCGGTERELTPSELGDWIMSSLQADIEEDGCPSAYKVTLKGPGGREYFERSKHINLRGLRSLRGSEEIYG